MGKKVLAYDFSVLENPLFTGVERYAASLLENLPQELPGWNLVGLWRKNPNRQFESMARAWNTRIDDSVWPRWAWRRLRLSKLAKEGKANLLVSPVAHVPIASEFLSCRTVHDLPHGRIESLEPPTWRQNLGDRSWRQQDVPTIFPSDGTKSIFANLLFQMNAPSTVIPHGLDENLFGQTLAVSDPGSRRIVVVGTVRPRRRPDIVEEALSTLLQTDPKAQVRWIGASRAPLPANSKIEFLGSLSDAEKWEEMARASCILCPSLIEGFGSPLVEGLAMGKPVISADHVVGREVGGDHALFYEGDSANDLIGAVRETWAMEPSLALAQERRAYARKFSWVKSTKEHAQFFRSLVLS